jgi:hypothetical protein
MSEAGTFGIEARWARQKAELATGEYRDLMIAIAGAYEVLAKLEEALAEADPLQDISDPN